MRRERVLESDERTLAADLLSPASTVTLERSCLLGARYLTVRTLQHRALARIDGAANMARMMMDVSEQRAGYMRRH